MNVHVQIEPHMISPLLALEIEALSLCLGGQVVLAGHADYDALRGIACSAWDDCPMLLARVANAADVADVVDFARRNQIDLAVRSGGHSVAGYSQSEGGVVVDLRDLDTIEIDLNAMTVWAGSGLTTGDLSRALDQHGVAIGFGDFGADSVGNLVASGVGGHLARHAGLAIDALVGAEIVTASGSILTISETCYPDLFWALRGGGGNLGIVTKTCYRLTRVPEFTGGALVLPATPQVLCGFVAAAKAAPDALTATVIPMVAPPLPFIPPELVGTVVLVGMMAYAGSDEAAQVALAPFRTLAEPIADTIRPGPYSLMFAQMPQATASLCAPAVFKDKLTMADATAILDRLNRQGSAAHFVQIRPLGGVAARMSSVDSGQRNADTVIAFMSTDGDDGVAPDDNEWAIACVAEIGGARQGRAQVNFMASQGEDMICAPHLGSGWKRLQRIKQTYDPTNLFRASQFSPTV